MTRTNKISVLLLLTTFVLGMCLVSPSQMGVNHDLMGEDGELATTAAVPAGGAYFTVGGHPISVAVDEPLNTTAILLDGTTSVNITVNLNDLSILINDSNTLLTLDFDYLTNYTEISISTLSTTMDIIIDYTIDQGVTLYFELLGPYDLFFVFDMVDSYIYWEIWGLLTIWIDLLTYEFYVWEWIAEAGVGFGAYLDFDFIEGPQPTYSADIYFLIPDSPQLDLGTIMGGAELPPLTDDNLTANLMQGASYLHDETKE